MTQEKIKKYICCPICGKVLMKGYGNCTFEITCFKCHGKIEFRVNEQEMITKEVS